VTERRRRSVTLSPEEGEGSQTAHLEILRGLRRSG